MRLILFGMPLTALLLLVPSLPNSIYTAGATSTEMTVETMDARELKKKPKKPRKKTSAPSSNPSTTPSSLPSSQPSSLPSSSPTEKKLQLCVVDDRGYPIPEHVPTYAKGTPIYSDTSEEAYKEETTDVLNTIGGLFDAASQLFDGLDFDKISGFLGAAGPILGIASMFISKSETDATQALIISEFRNMNAKLDQLSDKITSEFIELKKNNANLYLDREYAVLQRIQSSFSDYVKSGEVGLDLPMEERYSIRRKYQENFRFACNELEFRPEDIIRNLYGHACGDADFTERCGERGIEYSGGEKSGQCKFGVKNRSYLLDVFYKDSSVGSFRNFSRWLKNTLAEAYFLQAVCLPSDPNTCPTLEGDEVFRSKLEKSKLAIEEVAENLDDIEQCRCPCKVLEFVELTSPDVADEGSSIGTMLEAYGEMKVEFASDSTYKAVWEHLFPSSRLSKKHCSFRLSPGGPCLYSVYLDDYVELNANSKTLRKDMEVFRPSDAKNSKQKGLGKTVKRKVIGFSKSGSETRLKVLDDYKDSERMGVPINEIKLNLKVTEQDVSSANDIATEMFTFDSAISDRCDTFDEDIELNGGDAGKFKMKFRVRSSPCYAGFCSIESPDCEENNFCNFKKSTCEARKDAGYACAEDYECVRGTFCSNARNICTTGEDETCKTDFDCVRNMYCGDDNKCKKSKGADVSCTRDRECKNKCDGTICGVCRDVTFETTTASNATMAVISVIMESHTNITEISCVDKVGAACTSRICSNDGYFSVKSMTDENYQPWSYTITSGIDEDFLPNGFAFPAVLDGLTEATTDQNYKLNTF